MILTAIYPKSPIAGMYPLHVVTLSDNLEIAYLLFHHGAYINVYDAFYQQTPLMWACQSLLPNAEQFVRLYIQQVISL